MTMKKSIVAPLLYASILFLMIRLTNDLSTQSDYLSHSWRFIAIELTGVLAGTYLCDYLASRWLNFIINRNIGAFVEYAAVIVVPAGLCIVVMAISHDIPLVEELSYLIIPIVITVLMSFWFYLTIKSSYLNRLYIESRLKEQEARHARTEAELKLLRAQFHPHFLFNMLNTIYFTIDEDNVKARDTVENLSNLLRSQLYERNGTVAIEREISALKSYIELCRVRFGDTLELTTHISNDCKSAEIHPHLLLPLVENAVKHSGGNPRCVFVGLTTDESAIRLLVENTISSLKSIPKEEHGLGLSNLRKRLDLLYQNKYELIIEKDRHKFTANLKLEL